MTKRYKKIGVASFIDDENGDVLLPRDLLSKHNDAICDMLAEYSDAVDEDRDQHMQNQSSDSPLAGLFFPTNKSDSVIAKHKKLWDMWQDSQMLATAIIDG